MSVCGLLLLPAPCEASAPFLPALSGLNDFMTNRLMRIKLAQTSDFYPGSAGFFLGEGLFNDAVIS